MHLHGLPMKTLKEIRRLFRFQLAITALAETIPAPAVVAENTSVVVADDYVYYNLADRYFLDTFRK